MATNAPYYHVRPDHARANQMHAGQFSAAPSGANATTQAFVPQDPDYDLSSAADAGEQEHTHPPLYDELVVQRMPVDAQGNTFEENHNLVELLEAATTAAGQAARAMTADGASKRKRDESLAADSAAGTTQEQEAFGAKRRRVGVHTELHTDNYETRSRSQSETAIVPPSSEALLNDARAAGVHSAAALFRRSSEKTSRKYTRPPMSKLFMSLQLSPENFLQLQAHAKAYMLDPTHPERQSCVGNRGKGDTDMVKLRLFNCVRDFLNGGVGEQFFGEHVETPGETEAVEAARALGQEKMPCAGEKLLWPRDGNKIISLVTPLMRRMVTNERQRMYAIETRKGSAKKKEREGSVEAAAQRDVRDKLDQHSFDSSLTQPISPLVTIPITPGQQCYTQSPSTSRSTPRSTTTPTYITPYGPDLNLSLPKSDSSNPYLTHINIFLTLAPTGQKQGIRLAEKRIAAQHPDHLMFTSWNTLIHECVVLVKKVCTMYAELRWKKALQLPLGEPRTPENESLRGLARAANALQSEPTESEPVSSNPMEAHAGDKPSAPLLDFEAMNLEDVDHWLPRFAIKTLGTESWETIVNAGDWHRVLTEHAFAYWADGRCNVIVELEGVPGKVEGMERAGSVEEKSSHGCGVLGREDEGCMSSTI